MTLVVARQTDTAAVGHIENKVRPTPLRLNVVAAQFSAFELRGVTTAFTAMVRSLHHDPVPGAHGGEPLVGVERLQADRTDQVRPGVIAALCAGKIREIGFDSLWGPIRRCRFVACCMSNS
jgi:hypothetical protein